MVGFYCRIDGHHDFLSRLAGGMLAFMLEIVLFATLAFGKRRSLRAALGSMSMCISILALLIFCDGGRCWVDAGLNNAGISPRTA